MSHDSFEAHQAALDRENAAWGERLVKQYVERVKQRRKQEITVDDAVELLCACEPSPLDGPEYPESLRNHAEQAHTIRPRIEHAVAIGGANGLTARNLKAKPGEWRVRIADLVEWANRWDIGDRHIADKVASTLALSTEHPTSDRAHRRAKQFSDNRERVLGAALAVVARWPDQCRNQQGKFIAQKIADVIEANSILLFKHENDGAAPMSTRSMADHIKQWLDKI